MRQKEAAAEAANYQVRALERGLSLLDAFSLAAPELSLTALAARAGLAKSTATRLLAVLEARGYLERSPDTERYRVGVRAFELGSLYIQTTSLEAEAQPVMAHLARECRQTANLGVLSGAEVVHLAVVPPDRPIRFATAVGVRDRAHATGLGKALLAALDAAALADLVARHGLPPRTERTIATLDALVADLAGVRARGYAVDDEESFAGLKCVAAPIRDDKGRVVAAVSVSGPAGEFGATDLPRYTEAVTGAARAISDRLGHRVSRESGVGSRE
ncbi:MAG TPA: IclR family transcriptional regulator [Thermomicrobiales bacterium]|nr:IclR family transcriptional regulator [Thermomicrobiales bacterium]